MDNNKTGAGVAFGIKTDIPADEQKIKNAQSQEKAVEKDDTLEEPYTERRTITIALAKNYSLYRRANDKVLPKRRDFIGSSIESSRTLASNKEEIETYFPNIVGIAVNNPDFITRVKNYLNNIKIGVDELGKTFDCSFIYNHKKDYLRIKEQMDKIEEEYASANHKNIAELKKALQLKITNINILESTKCKLGYPVNVEEYLMYRHCLLYRDIAKDTAFINSDPYIRFYFRDDVKEAEQKKKLHDELKIAMTRYVECLSDAELFNAVYIQYCAMNSHSILNSIAKPQIDKEIELNKFSTEQPSKFNAIVKNKDTKLIANIELLIARGELVRSQYNQNITSEDGTFIGANMKEAVAWFKNPANTSIVNAYTTKLKL